MFTMSATDESGATRILLVLAWLFGLLLSSSHLGLDLLKVRKKRGGKAGSIGNEVRVQNLQQKLDADGVVALVDGHNAANTSKEDIGNGLRSSGSTLEEGNSINHVSLVIKVGGHRGRVDNGNIDTVDADFRGKGLSKVGQVSLGGAVKNRKRGGHEPSRRRGEGDTTAELVLAHKTDVVVSNLGSSGGVDIVVGDLALPVAVSEESSLNETSVVDDNADLVVLGLLGESLHEVAVGKVDANLYKLALGELGSEFINGLVEEFVREGDNNNVKALASETLNDSATNAGGSTSHEGPCGCKSK